MFRISGHNYQLRTATADNDGVPRFTNSLINSKESLHVSPRLAIISY
jgi:hypothetical protein